MLGKRDIRIWNFLYFVAMRQMQQYWLQWLTHNERWWQFANSWYRSDYTWNMIVASKNSNSFRVWYKNQSKISPSERELGFEGSERTYMCFRLCPTSRYCSARANRNHTELQHLHSWPSKTEYVWHHLKSKKMHSHKTEWKSVEGSIKSWEDNATKQI
jgi:hypothetical protein